jgi:microcystin-dependent protein
MEKTMKKILLTLSLLIFANVFCHADPQKYKITTSTKTADAGYSIKGSQKYEICADTASAPVVTISSYTVNLGGKQTGNEQGVKVGSSTVADVANSVAVNSVSPAAMQAGNYSLGTSSMTVYYLYVSSLVATGFTASGGSGGFDSMPVGAIIEFISTTTMPSDFAYLNGQTLSRTSDAQLWAYAQSDPNLIGTSPGQFGVGDGVTTFTVPDRRGYFTRAWDDGKGIDANRVINSTQTSTFQGHRHELSGTSPWILSSAGTGGNINTTGSAYPNSAGGVGSPITDGVNGTPSTGPETRPINVTTVYGMKRRLSTQTQGALNPDRTWKVVYSTTIAANCSSFIATGLNGDYDETYMVRYMFKTGDAAQAATYRLGLAGDTTSICGFKRIVGDGSTSASSTDNTFQGLYLCTLSAGSGKTASGEAKIFAKTGSVRNAIITQINGSDASSAPGIETTQLQVARWNNTTVNISSMTFWTGTTNGIGAGSYIEILALSTSTVSVGVASQLASNTNAVIQADQDNDGVGNIVMKVGSTEYACIDANGMRIVQSTWTAPTFQNSWVNNGSWGAPAGYMKDSMGFIHLRGIVKSGTVGATMFTLPAGYRPSYLQGMTVPSNNGVTVIGWINILATGEVQAISPSGNSWLSLDGITFMAEQ